MILTVIIGWPAIVLCSSTTNKIIYCRKKYGRYSHCNLLSLCSTCLRTVVWRTYSWIGSTTSSPLSSLICWEFSSPQSHQVVSYKCYILFRQIFSLYSCQFLFYTNIPTFFQIWNRSLSLFAGYIHSRVEEEFLWDCKQLGAYSPIVLLNSLLFFCCKYFGFTTVEQHRQLSFAHIVNCNKTNENNTKTTFLRFCRSISINESGTIKAQGQNQVPDFIKTILI